MYEWKSLRVTACGEDAGNGWGESGTEYGILDISHMIVVAIILRYNQKTTFSRPKTF